jgi:sterol desaturase/sphingolipid hydroxylase (fatty acid hydroxylase superfamily)
MLIIPLAYWAAVAIDYAMQRQCYQDRVSRKHSMLTGLNVCFVMPLALAAMECSVPFSRHDIDYGQEIVKIAVLVVVEEVVFYSAHRILHTLPILFRSVHSIHHEPIRPDGMHAFYAHPLEVLIVNLGPVALTHSLVQFHRTSFTFALCIGLVNTVLSGHTSRLQSGPHQIHHRRFNCNYGFLFMDYIFRTHACPAAAKQ